MASRLTEPQITERLTELPTWKREGDAIRRTLKFPDFKAAMAFVNRVADLAEQMDHHPDLLIRYTTVALTLTTHSAGGLTVMDFELARRIEGAIRRPPGGQET